MGGGRKYMFPKNTSDVEYPGIAKHSGTRKDMRNLVQEWTDKMKDKVCFFPTCCLCSFCFSASSFIFFVCLRVQNDSCCAVRLCRTEQKGHYVWNKKQLLSLNPNNVDYLLGEFPAPYHSQTFKEV